MRWRDLGHLASRFFTVLRGAGPEPRAQAEAAALLRPPERDLFWAQAATDQRHGVAAARLILEAYPGDRSLARAALLHDVGKRHARLGAIGRSVASMLALLRLPAPGRLGMYLDHGSIGAAELEAIGAEDVVVGYAAGHQHDDRPSYVPEPVWRALRAADRRA